MPRLEIPQVVPERPLTPYPGQRQFSQTIPFVESRTTASSYSGIPLDDYRRTPEWQEYRNSIATTDSSIRVAEGVLRPARTVSTLGGVDSDNAETETDRASTTAVFYRRQQVPVDAVDTLQVIVDNLEVLRKEELVQRYHQAFDKAYRYLVEVIRILDKVPREVTGSIPFTRNFAQFLNSQYQYLIERIISPANLINPDLYRDITKLHSNLRAKKLHQSFLTGTQRA